MRENNYGQAEKRRDFGQSDMGRGRRGRTRHDASVMWTAIDRLVRPGILPTDGPAGRSGSTPGGEAGKQASNQARKQRQLTRNSVSGQSVGPFVPAFRHKPHNRIKRIQI